MFVRGDAVNVSNLQIDQQAMDAVGGVGGHTLYPYARPV